MNTNRGLFYNSTIKNLCIGRRYEFSVYLANVCKIDGLINPNVRFEVRSAAPNSSVLAQLDSGSVPVNTTVMVWKKYGLSFQPPTSSIVLLMISNVDGGAGNDLALDDIALRVCSDNGNGFCDSQNG
ncbi:hypothetical protein I4U23_015326 [Adineta vaga]|nr:hypothetical protein I4U23_015326 [Adineta vaga]